MKKPVKHPKKKADTKDGRATTNDRYAVSLSDDTGASNEDTGGGTGSDGDNDDTHPPKPPVPEVEP